MDTDKMQERNIEDYKLEEELRTAAFNRIKDMYKKSSLFERVAKKAKGESPDWKAIEGYNLDTLEYLEDVRRGDTFMQKEMVRQHDMNARKTKGELYTDEQLKQKRFEQFKSKLMKSEAALRQEIEFNKKKSLESYEKYGRNIYR